MRVNKSNASVMKTFDKRGAAASMLGTMSFNPAGSNRFMQPSSMVNYSGVTS